MSHSMFGTRGQMRWHSRPPKKDATIAKLRGIKVEQDDELRKLKAERQELQKRLQAEQAVGVLGRLKRSAKQLLSRVVRKKG